MVVNAEGVANGRQRRRRSQMVVNAEGVRKWSSTPKAFASLSPGLFQPWVSKYCQRQRRRCWLGVVCERFQRCEDLFWRGAQGCFNPGLASIAKATPKVLARRRLRTLSAL